MKQRDSHLAHGCFIRLPLPHFLCQIFQAIDFHHGRFPLSYNTRHSDECQPIFSIVQNPTPSHGFSMDRSQEEVGIRDVVGNSKKFSVAVRGVVDLLVSELNSRLSKGGEELGEEERDWVRIGGIGGNVFVEDDESFSGSDLHFLLFHLFFPSLNWSQRLRVSRHERKTNVLGRGSDSVVESSFQRYGHDPKSVEASVLRMGRKCAAVVRL